MSCQQPDADGDGYRAVDCGGNDCNDNDPAINPYAADDWTVEVVEHTTFAMPGYGALATAIGVTSKGAVHIVRRVDAELYDFTNETGSWVGARVTAGPATFPVVAIDSNDVVRVAFAGAETDLATRVNASTWTISMIDVGSSIGPTVASNDVLRAVYTAGQLRHASTATGPWTYEVLPTVVSSGLGPPMPPR